MTTRQQIVGVLALAACAVVGTKLQLNQTLEYDLSDQSLAYLNAYMTSEKKGSGSSNSEKGSSNSGSNSEKGGWLKDLSEWWNRNDYVCRNAVCFLVPGVEYPTTYWVRVADGTGTEPHSWCCAGCDQGFIMIRDVIQKK